MSGCQLTGTLEHLVLRSGKESRHGLDRSRLCFGKAKRTGSPLEKLIMPNPESVRDLEKIIFLRGMVWIVQSMMDVDKRHW